VGNHEDGYLIGIDNLVDLFAEIQEEDDIQPTPDHQYDDDTSNNNNTPCGTSNSLDDPSHKSSSLPS